MAHSADPEAYDWRPILEEAILSGNIKNLKESFTKIKHNGNLQNTDLELEVQLSKIYEELKIKNVTISEDIENLIVYNIVDLRFFTKNDLETQQELTASLEDINERIDQVIKSMNYLVEKFHASSLLGDFFVLECTSVVKHVDILKHLLRSTYDKLPWEEFEFCLAVFLMILVKPSEADDVFKLVLDTKRVLEHINTFKCGLEKTKPLLNKKNINKKLRLVGRNQFIQSVRNFNNGFVNLYHDYDLIKDISSLRRIDSYIQVCTDLDFEETKSLDKLIIERTLQVIGECLKDTPDSPNISQEVQEVLKKSAPNNLKQIITSLRDSLSHTEALNQKVKMEHRKSTKCFQDVQNDLRKIHFEIQDMLWKRKIAAGGAFAKKILQYSSLEEVRALTKTLGKISETKAHYKSVTMKELDDVQDLVKQLEFILEGEPEVKLLQQVKEDLSLQTDKIKISFESYLSALYALDSCVDEIESNNNIIFIKNLFRSTHDLIEGDRAGFHFESIIPAMWNIKTSINKRSTETVEVADKIITEILDLIMMKSERINDISRLQISLERSETEEDNAIKKYKEIVEIIMENAKKCLEPQMQQCFKKAFQAKKDVYEAKSELICIINLKKPNIEASPLVIERCKQLAKSLKMKKNNETNFLSNFVSGDINICKSLVSIIDDPYGLLLTYISEFNSFSYKKQAKAFGNFLASLKLKNLPIEIIMKYFADENVKQIRLLYANRLNLLKTTLLGNDLEDQWDAMQKFRCNKKIQLATELILLDMLNVLEDSSFLFDNRLYLDDYVPIPLGKALRNYLAHGNFLIDALPFNVPLTVVSNAMKLMSEGENLIEKENVLIGKKIPIDTFKVKNVPEKMKFTMINQHMMYEAGRSNDLLLLFASVGQGAKLAGRGVNGWCGLHYAASADSVEAFNIFVDNFVNLEKQDNLLSDVLHVAILNRSRTILDYCLSKFELEDVSELVYFAAECGNEEIVARLISHCTEASWCNAFCIAAANGQKDIIELLLKNEIKNMGNSLAKSLNLASKNGHKEIVEILLSNNFDPNAAVEDYASPVYLATRNGHADIVEILLKNGAKINQICREKALNFSSHDFTSFFREIDKIISSSVICEDNMIPLLHLACIFGYKDIVEILLKNHLEINQTTDKIFTPLHIAVACEQIDTIQLLLEKGADVNSLPGNVISPLHLAAKNGSCEIIDLLLRNGAKVDTMGKDKYTPLHVACVYGRNEAVQLLIARESDVNAKTITGGTALSFASGTGDTNIVKGLLKTGAATDSYDQNGNTPLHVASFNGFPNIVTLLLHGNAKVDSINDEITPLHCAASRGFTDIVNILLQFGADVNKCDLNGNTALIFAMQGSHCDVIECLLSKGADVNACNVDKVTPIFLAVKNGLSEIVNELILKGAECSSRTLENVCPFDLAVCYGYTQIVCSLLFAGAEVNAGSTGGITPLCLACKHGHTDIVNVLLRSGASVNKTDELLGISPLHDACANQYKEIVEILLEAGADVSARDHGECIPLQIASIKGNTDVIHILLENGSGEFINSPNLVGETPLFLAAESGSVEAVNLLLEKGARMDSVDLEGYTVLHSAAHHGYEKVAKIFLDAGIPADVQSFEGVTPLHMAAECDSSQVIEILLNYGAQVNKENSENFSALHIAAKSGSKKVLELLLTAGAKINQWTNEGLTEIHYAAQNNDPDIIRMLLLEGVDVDCLTVDTNQTTPLHYASLFGNAKVVSVLIENGAKIDSENVEGLTPLEMASIGEHKDVELILEQASSRGKDLPKKEATEELCIGKENLQETLKHVEGVKNAETEALDETCITFNNNTQKEKENPLLSAVKENLGTESLLKIATALSEMEEIDQFLLHIAILSGDEDAVTKLLNENASLSKRLLGMLPMQLAGEMGNINIFSAIVARTEGGYLPVHVAAINGFLKILNILFAKGCDVDERTSEKSTSLHFAARNGDVTTMLLLIDHGADVYARNFHNTVLHEATTSQNVEALRIILDVMKKDGRLDAINARDEDGDTALMWAIENSLFESATVLLEYGSDVNIQNNSGMTVLHWCVLSDNLDLLELMLKQPGIDTRLKDKNNKTVLDLVEEKSKHWCSNGVSETEIKHIKIILEKMFDSS